MVTSAPAMAAPCSSVTAPRTAAVITCACASNEVQRTSASTASSEPIEHNLPCWRSSSVLRSTRTRKRSEEHTPELQSHLNPLSRLLLEKTTPHSPYTT